MPDRALAAETARALPAPAGGGRRALQTETGGWRDISLDGRRLRWRNETYE